MLELEEDNIIKIIIELLEVNKIQLSELQKYSSEDFIHIVSLFKNGPFNNTTDNPISDYLPLTSSIIKDLQFQDIMRQKIEHIETIDDILLRELKQRLSGNGGIIYSSVISEITALNVAQLQLILEEYRIVMDNITLNLKELETKLKQSSPMDYNLSAGLSQNQQTHTLIMDIIERHTLISQLPLEYNHKRKKETKKVMAKLMNIYTMQSERDVFMQVFESEISNSTDNHLENNQENNIEFF